VGIAPVIKNPMAWERWNKNQHSWRFHPRRSGLPNVINPSTGTTSLS
jgi:hypothetical protein